MTDDQLLTAYRTMCLIRAFELPPVGLDHSPDARPLKPE